jgi:hypothetical protein
MDPDMVRQQEEAEREASAPSAKMQTVAASSGPGVVKSPVYFENKPVHAVRPQVSGAKLRGEPAMDAFSRFGRFWSFGLAGGMLGGGLGIAAANYWQLSFEQAQLAIIGPAAVMALVCAIVSLFIRQSKF